MSAEPPEKNDAIREKANHLPRPASRKKARNHGAAERHCYQHGQPHRDPREDGHG
jgi:hypothetical protein